MAQVFDECHHATNMHPFNEILMYYKEANGSGSTGTQVRPLVKLKLSEAC